MEEAIDYKNGNKAKARAVVSEIPVPEYNAEDVLRVRSALQLSQRGLAIALGVSVRTVESWEGKRNQPSGAARHLLYLLEKNNVYPF